MRICEDEVSTRISKTIEEMGELLNTIDGCVADRQNELELVNLSLELARSLLLIRLRYQILQTIRGFQGNAIVLNLELQKQFSHLDINELEEISPEAFNLTNFVAADDFLRQSLLPRLRERCFKQGRIDWPRKKKTLLYIQKSLARFTMLLGHGHFPAQTFFTEEGVDEFLQCVSLGEEGRTRYRLSIVRQVMLQGYSLLGTVATPVSSPFVWASNFFTPGHLHALTQLFSAERRPSLNYIEEQRLLSSPLRLVLPVIGFERTIFFERCSSLFDAAIYARMVATDFTPSEKFLGDYTPRKPIQPVRRSHDDLVKVKLLYNVAPPTATVDAELLPEGTAVAIYVPGGGFVADLEKLSQFHLRE